MSDFFLPVQLSTQADGPTVAAFQKVLLKAQSTLSWLPNIANESAQLFYASPPMFPRLNPIPEGLDDGQQQQWKMIYDAAAPITSAAMRGEMQAAQIQGQQLADDSAFWDSVYRVTLDVATLGTNELWGDFWDAIAACKEARDGAAAALQGADNALAALGENADPDDVANQNDLQGQLNALLGNIIDVIAPLGPDVRAQAGLGVAPLVVAGIAAATILAITGSVWAIAHELAAVQKQANDHAQAVFDHQTAYDENLAAQGVISQDELMRRRANTAQQAKDVANSQGAGSMTSAMAAGLGVLALGAVAVVFLMNKSRKTATNPRRR